MILQSVGFADTAFLPGRAARATRQSTAVQDLDRNSIVGRGNGKRVSGDALGTAAEAQRPGHCSRGAESNQPENDAEASAFQKSTVTAGSGHPERTT